MTLDNILKEVKHGKDFVELEQKLEEIQNFVNKDNTFMVSKRAEQLLSECDNTKSYIKKLSRAARNFKEYEDKIINDSVSSIYSRMKIDSITENINSSIIEFENKKILRECNQEIVGKIIAILEHGVKIISEKSGLPLKSFRDAPGLVGTYLHKEFTLIESII